MQLLVSVEMSRIKIMSRFQLRSCIDLPFTYWSTSPSIH